MKVSATAQSMLPLARWATNAAALVSAITSREERQRQPEQERECGHDEKTTADTEEAGQDTRADADRSHARE